MKQSTANLSDRAAKQRFLRATIQVVSVDEQIRTNVEKAMISEVTDPLKLAASLSDIDVLAMADYQLTKCEQQRLNKLLEANREGQLSAGQNSELDSILDHCMAGMLRKSIGWAEAVRRCLRKSPFGNNSSRRD